MNIIGDVAGRRCVLLDDMVDSAGTFCNAAAALLEAGAASVFGLCNPRGAVGRGGGAGRNSPIEVAGDDRQHHGDQSGARGEQHPPGVDRTLDGRGNPPYQRGTVGL